MSIFVVTSFWQLWKSIINSSAVIKHSCKQSPYIYISRWMNWHNSFHSLSASFCIIFSQANVKILIATVIFRVLYYSVFLVNVLVCNEPCRKMNTLIITLFKSNFLLNSLRNILSWCNYCNCTGFSICSFIYKYMESPDSLACVILLNIFLAVWRRSIWVTWSKPKSKIKKNNKNKHSLIVSRPSVS